MDWDSKLTADYKISLAYRGWGMPLTLDILLNNMHLYYGEIRDDLTLSGSIPFDHRTTFYLDIGLRGKTYAHTDLINNRDHEIEIVGIEFLGYELINTVYTSRYHAHIDCEQPNPATMITLLGAKSMGQNGRWQLGTVQNPFYDWYQDVTHQGYTYTI